MMVSVSMTNLTFGAQCYTEPTECIFFQKYLMLSQMVFWLGLSSFVKSTKIRPKTDCINHWNYQKIFLIQVILAEKKFDLFWKLKIHFENQVLVIFCDKWTQVQLKNYLFSVWSETLCSKSEVTLLSVHLLQDKVLIFI